MTQNVTSQPGIFTLAAIAMIAGIAAPVHGRGQPPRPLVLSVPGIPGSIHEPAAREAFRQVVRAQDAVSRACIESRRDFEASSEFQKALTDARQARIEFDRARTDLVKRMQESTAYQAAQIDLWKAQEELDALRTSKAPAGAVAAAAAQVLHRRTAISRIENDLVENDESLKQKQFAAIDAEARVAGLRRSFDESITTDPKYQAARAELDNARKRLSAIGR
jgi:hypothetical protein